VSSHNLAQIKIDDLDIIGYSIGGEETVVAMPQLDVCFDIGKAPDQVISINNVLLTHGHIDHTAGFAYYLSHRNFCGQAPGKIYIPKNLVRPMKQIIDAWGYLDGNPIPAEIIGVEAGEEYQIKPNLYARVFPTKHSAGSVGYCIIEKRKKLKAEFANFTGPQIVELKKQKIAIDNIVELPIVTYLGDTQYVDYSKLEYIKDSAILIAECTFYTDEHQERAQAGRHMHLNDFAKLMGDLNNQHIVVTHTTQRTSMDEIRKSLKSVLPSDKFEKIIILMDSRRSRK
jgi:ribonuclease Z